MGFSRALDHDDVEDVASRRSGSIKSKPCRLAPDVSTGVRICRTGGQGEAGYSEEMWVRAMPSRSEKRRIGTREIAGADLFGREGGAVNSKLVKDAVELGVDGEVRPAQPIVHVLNIGER